MLKKIQLEKPDDYFIDLGKRKNRGVFFYRLNGYNRQIHAFIQKYYETARLNGVIIEGKLQNPDNNNLAYFNEILGSDFCLDQSFIDSKLRKWLPRMSERQRRNVTSAIYDTLMRLRQSGKNDNMLKNAYIKFMCWLYYKFERIVGQLGEEKIPKILYEGTVSNYELLLMNMLSAAGCDILLLQYGGDSGYLKADPESASSYDLKLPNMTAFSENFSLKQIRKDIQDAFNTERLYGSKPQILNCTNAWISGKIMEDVRKNIASRGNDPAFFYNCFAKITGAEDRLTYENELYQLQKEMKGDKRHIVIVNNTITSPSTEEISAIKRQNYKNGTDMIQGLSANIQYSPNSELHKIIKKAFIDLMLEEEKKENSNLNRLTNKAVYILCWFKRYQQQLFGNWKPPEIGCFFYFGACKNDSEALFLRFLARTPVDVLIFNPNRNQMCCLQDDLLYEVNNEFSLNTEKYPEDNSEVRIATSAYHAERDLDTLMYTDTGIYRNQQYTKANAIILRTMYEEIAILWNQELKYRSSFNTSESVVSMPVFFSKICGVKDGNLPMYWSHIKTLITQDTVLIKNVPEITSVSENPVKAYATEFLKNGKLLRSRIKEHKAYQYGFLRDAMQEHILDKIQSMIDEKIIKGTMENGTEYTIVSTALNLDKNLIRMIQKFDFTKKNPKLIYVITGETNLSLEDTIHVTLLNMIGFDVLFFVPTGYQCVEKYYQHKIIEEHQIGEYLYDLDIPDFDAVPAISNTRPSLRDKIFRRGI